MLELSDFLKQKYSGFSILVISEFIPEALDILKHFHSKTFIPTSDRFYQYARDKVTNLKSFKFEYFKKIKLEDQAGEITVTEETPVEEVNRLILKYKPKYLKYLEHEISADKYHSEMTEAEILCYIYGVKFIRVHPVLSFILCN